MQVHRKVERSGKIVSRIKQACEIVTYENHKETQMYIDGNVSSFSRLFNKVCERLARTDHHQPDLAEIQLTLESVLDEKRKKQMYQKGKVDINAQ